MFALGDGPDRDVHGEDRDAGGDSGGLAGLAPALGAFVVQGGGGSGGRGQPVQGDVGQQDVAVNGVLGEFGRGIGPLLELLHDPGELAEDRSREACEDARQLRAEYERIKGKKGVPVREETDASLRADAGDETAHHAGQVAAQAAETSRQADVALAESREGLAGAERELERARKLAAIPAGEAPISDATMRACSAYMQSDEVWDGLSDRDRFRARRAGEPRDMMSDAQFQAMFRSTFGREGSVV